QNHRPIIAAAQRLRADVQPQPALVILRAVAGITGGLENRPHIADEIDLALYRLRERRKFRGNRHAKESNCNCVRRNDTVKKSARKHAESPSAFSATLHNIS